MGYGEDYLFRFLAWYNALSNNDKTRYQALFPTPLTWRGFYSDNLSDKGIFVEHHVIFWNKYGNMKYTVDSLIARQAAGEELDIVFFWNPGELPEDCLCQWQPSNFQAETQKYSCAEQYMMAAKARVFEDTASEEMILKAPDPKTMKSLGRNVRNFVSSTWDKVKYSVILKANYCKFTQNSEMRNFLISTGDKILVEASPFDVIWGIGLSKDNPASLLPSLWRGHNLLGFALMEVRDEITSVFQNYNRISWNQLEDDI